MDHEGLHSHAHTLLPAIDRIECFFFCKNLGPVTVSRPRLYARIPPIQNLGETEVAWEKKVFFYFLGGHFFHKKARAHGACGLKIWNVE